MLTSGREHSVETKVGLLVDRDFVSERLSFQLVLGGLDLELNDEQALRSRWQKFGTLYAGSIRTDPFAVTLPRSRDFQTCAGAA